MGLTDDEMNRLEALAHDLEHSDPRLARALSNSAPRPTRPAALLPRSARTIAFLVCAVTGCALVAASVPLQQPILFAIGALTATALPCARLVRRLRRRNDLGPS